MEDLRWLALVQVRRMLESETIVRVRMIWMFNAGTFKDGMISKESLSHLFQSEIYHSHEQVKQ